MLGAPAAVLLTWALLACCAAWVLVYSALYPVSVVDDAVQSGVHMSPATPPVSAQIFTYLFALVGIPALVAPFLLRTGPLPLAQLWRTWRVPSTFGLTGTLRFSLIESVVLVVWAAVLVFSTLWDVKESLKRFDARGGAGPEEKMLTWGVSFGRMAMINMAIFLIPVSRTSFWLELLGVGFDSAVRFHQYMGAGVVAGVVIHGMLIIRQYDWTLGGENIFLQNVFGLVSMCGAVLIAITSLHAVRRRWYRLFYICHAVGFTAFFLFGVLHHRFVLTHAFPAFVTWFADKLLSMSRRFQRAPLGRAVVSDEAGVARLAVRAESRMRLRPGAHMMVNVPAASRFEWHPISVAWVEGAVGGSGDEQLVSLDIKSSGGNWSQRVVEAARSQGAELVVRLNGPFGGDHARNMGFMAHRTQLFVCGGIGLTPMLFALETIAARLDQKSLSKSPGAPSSSAATLIWVVPSRAMLDLYRAQLNTVAALGCGDINIQVYVTAPQDDGAPSAASEQFQASDVTSSLRPFKAGPGANPVANSVMHIFLTVAMVLGVVVAYSLRSRRWTAQTFLFYALASCLVAAVIAGPIALGVVHMLRFGAVGDEDDAALAAVTPGAGGENKAARKTDEDELSILDAESGGSRDQLPPLSDELTVRFGARPDLEAVMGDHVLRNSCTGSVGVAVCGPRGMANDVFRTSVRLSDRHGVELVVDHDAFEW